MAVSQSLTLTQSSQSVTGNYSKVRILWKSTQTGASYNAVTRTGYYYVSINGGAETRYSVSYTLPKGSTKTIVDATITVNHKADGTGTVKVRTWMDTHISAGEVTLSKSLTLDTIPRATTPKLSASAADMGTAVTISLPRASSSFTHDLAYSFNGAAYVSIATGVGTSYKWTVPDKATSIPNATSGIMTVRCITKNGSTTIGTKTVNLTARVPEKDAQPLISAAVVEAVAGISEITGSAFLQNMSKLAVTITATPRKGASIVSYKSVIQGKTYTKASFTTDVLTQAGTWEFFYSAKDSRGFEVGAWYSLTVDPYNGPVISHFSAERCDNSGTAQTDGDYVLLRYNYKAPPQGNTAEMKVQYKRATDDDANYATLYTYSGASADTTAAPVVVELTSDYSYDLRMTVTDYFGKKTTATTFLPSAEVILDVGADGESLAVGGTAEQPGFTVKWPTRLNGGRAEMVLADGADLDAMTDPNIYAGNAATTAKYLNCPVTTATSFTLEVAAGGDSGQLMQRITTCTKTAPITWVRFYYSNAWGEWLCISNFGNKVLWTGAMYMTAGHTATLGAPVSAQPSGIVLVFSEYVDGAAADQSFHTRYVPKALVSAHNGRAHTFQLTSGGLGYFAVKYLYIHDDKIVGHEINNQTGTGTCGIAYTNNRFVLRYVIGV